jgi:hypothetical protein
LVSPSQQPKVLDLFPPGSLIDEDGELVVGGCRLTELAATWGTPPYVVGEGSVRANVRRFRDALTARWADSRMVFASKAFPCTAMYRLMASEGIGVDVAGAGELAMALAGGVDPALIVMHGNAKTTAELAMAVDAGVGLIVVDNEDDVDRLEGLVRSEQPVLLRVIPGVRPDTHEAVATGRAGSKFGCSRTTRGRSSRGCGAVPVAYAAALAPAAAGSASTGCMRTSARRSWPPNRTPGRLRRWPGSANSPCTTWAAGSGSATPTVITRPARKTGSAH